MTPEDLMMDASFAEIDFPNVDINPSFVIMKCRTQFDPRPEVKYVDWPDSVVQSGMSPSISKMVKTRSVGGQIDEYEMDGIETGAPFDSEYLDFFDIADLANELGQESAEERGSAIDPNPGGIDVPPGSAPSSENSGENQS